MIARRFTAWATHENAPKYTAFFRDTLTPKLREIRGHLGAMVLNRSDGGLSEITVITFWESMDSIQHFAGSTLGTAVVEPEARSLFTSYADEVTHHEVVLDTLT
ncbi:MAG: antibiotic biosynthesis monooxygenase [Polyangiaceae bacterium]